MSEINENKIDEQNINEKEPKKKRSKLVIFTVILLIAIVGYVGYKIARPYVMTMLGSNRVETIEKLEVGKTYVYSEEQKAEFREAANRLKDKQVAERDLKPGDNYNLKEFWDSYTEAGFVEEDYGGDKGAEEFGYISNLENHYRSEDREIVYYTEDINEGVYFNEDLSLAEPNLFYGYTSVGNSYYAKRGFPGEEDKKQNEFALFVRNIEILDEKYKNTTNNDLRDFLQKQYEQDFYIFNMNNRVFNSMEDLEGYVIGPQKYAFSKWYGEVKKNSSNALQTFLFMKPQEINYKGVPFTYDVNPNKELSDVTLYPEEYNSFFEKNNYFATYVPHSVTKMEDDVYLIKIEVDQELDRLGVAMILKDLYLNFAKSHIGENIEVNIEDIKFDVMVQIQYKDDLSNGLVVDYGIYDIQNRNQLYDIDGEYAMATNSIMSNTMSMWFPDEEAQVWVAEYFDIAKEAYDNDSHFSIFDTISDLADKYDVPEKDMKSVIMSYYYLTVSTMLSY